MVGGLDQVRLIPGAQAQDFYYQLAFAATPGAAEETERFFEDGVLAKVRLGLEHYAHAVALHRCGKIGDAELTFLALLVRLGDELLPGAVTASLLQSTGLQEDRSGLPPALSFLTTHRIRRIKGMAIEALLGWQRGEHPGILAMGSVAPTDLLQAQASGYRHVGVGLATPSFAVIDSAYPGGFIHHDLCHLAKYRGPISDPRVYAGQVGFFKSLERLLPFEPELLHAPVGLSAGLDLSLVVTDTNGDCRLLLTLLLERLIARKKLVEVDTIATLITTTLAHLGFEQATASTLAPIYRPDRTAFLAETGPFFEALGFQTLKTSRLL